MLLRLAFPLAWSALCTIYLVLAVAAVREDGPFHLGLSVQQGSSGTLVVDRVLPGGMAWDAGVRGGDTLLALDGFRADVTAWDASSGRARSFTFRRAGSGDVVAVASPLYTDYTRVLVVALFIVGVAFALTSYFLAVRARRSAATMVVSLLFLAVAIPLAISSALALWAPWALLAVALALPWIGALFLLLFSVFPGERWSTSPRRMVLTGTFLTWAVILNTWFILIRVSGPTTYEAMRLVTLIYFGIGILGGIGLLVRTYLTTKSPVAREQIRIVAFGTVLSTLPFTLLGAIPTVRHVAGLVVRPETTALFLVFMPQAFSYAIMRHQLWGFRRLAHRTAAYALMSVVALGLYQALIASLAAVGDVSAAMDPLTQAAILGLLFVGMPLISGTRRLAFATVDRFLYREVLAQAVRSATASTTDRRGLLASAVEVLGPDLRLTFAGTVEVGRYGPVAAAVHRGAVPFGLLTVLAGTREAHEEMGPEVRTADLPDDGGQILVVPLSSSLSVPPLWSSARRRRRSRSRRRTSSFCATSRTTSTPRSRRSSRWRSYKSGANS